MVRVLEEGSDKPRTVVYLNRGETFGVSVQTCSDQSKMEISRNAQIGLQCLVTADIQSPDILLTTDPKTLSLLRAGSTLRDRWRKMLSPRTYNSSIEQ